MKIDSKELLLRQEILRTGALLHQKNMLAAADGNISYRMSNDKILITPSGRPKAFIIKEELAVVNIEGEVIEGNPSSELKMHLQIYKTCPEAKCVVHAHPPNAIAWTVACPELKELPAKSLSEVILATGGIPFVPYARPGSQEMGEVLKEFLPTNKAMILSRHGALSWGENLEEAYMGMERIEHSALILRLAKSMGEITELPAEEVNALYQMRREIGNKSL